MQSLIELKFSLWKTGDGRLNLFICRLAKGWDTKVLVKINLYLSMKKQEKDWTWRLRFFSLYWHITLKKKLGKKTLKNEPISFLTLDLSDTCLGPIWCWVRAPYLMLKNFGDDHTKTCSFLIELSMV